MQAEHQPRREPRPDHVGGLAAVSRERDRLPSAGQAPQARRGGPTYQLDLSITEIAVMWILHYWTVPRRPLRSLTQDIVEFYPVALDAILRADAMRGARQSDLRLIYFKGLIVAQTHPKPEMIDAIRRADREWTRDELPSEQPEAFARRSAESQPPEDQDTLAHVADALGHSPKSPH